MAVKDSFLFHVIDYTEPDSAQKQRCIAENKTMYAAYSKWCKEKTWKPDSLN